MDQTIYMSCKIRLTWLDSTGGYLYNADLELTHPLYALAFQLILEIIFIVKKIIFIVKSGI